MAAIAIIKSNIPLQGSPSSPTCYCDLLCHSIGDCCDDILDIGCGGNVPSSCVAAGFHDGCCTSSQPSCQGTNGTTSCYCDQLCYTVGDCCNDVSEIGCIHNTTTSKLIPTM